MQFTPDWRRRIAREAISLEGQVCEICGTDKNLGRHSESGYKKPIEDDVIHIYCGSCRQRAGKVARGCGRPKGSLNKKTLKTLTAMNSWEKLCYEAEKSYLLQKETSGSGSS